MVKLNAYSQGFGHFTLGRKSSKAGIKEVYPDEMSTSSLAMPTTQNLDQETILTKSNCKTAKSATRAGSGGSSNGFCDLLNKLREPLIDYQEKKGVPRNM